MNTIKILTTFLSATICFNSMAFSLWSSQPAKPTQQVKNNPVAKKVEPIKPAFSYANVAQEHIANAAGITYILWPAKQNYDFNKAYQSAFNTHGKRQTFVNQIAAIKPYIQQQILAHQSSITSKGLSLFGGWEAGNYVNSAINNFKKEKYDLTTKDLALSAGLLAGTHAAFNSNTHNAVKVLGSFSAEVAAIERFKKAHDAWQKNNKEEALKHAAMGVGLAGLGILPLISNTIEIEAQKSK